MNNPQLAVITHLRAALTLLDEYGPALCAARVALAIDCLEPRLLATLPIQAAMPAALPTIQTA